MKRLVMRTRPLLVEPAERTELAPYPTCQTLLRETREATTWAVIHLQLAPPSPTLCWKKLNSLCNHFLFIYFC